MGFTNKEYRQRGLELLTPYRKTIYTITAVIAALMIIIGAMTYAILTQGNESRQMLEIEATAAITLFAFFPLILSLKCSCLNMVRGEIPNGEFGQDFKKMMRKYYWKHVVYSIFLLLVAVGIVTAILRFIMIGSVMMEVNIMSFFSTSLLLVLCFILGMIPTIIFLLMYSWTTYIIKDNQNISAYKATMRSCRSIRGHKAKLFSLCFSYIGWFLLCIITLGIATIWALPRLFSATALFYDNQIKLAAENNETPVA